MKDTAAILWLVVGGIWLFAGMAVLRTDRFPEAIACIQTGVLCAICSNVIKGRP